MVARNRTAGRLRRTAQIVATAAIAVAVLSGIAPLFLQGGPAAAQQQGDPRGTPTSRLFDAAAVNNMAAVQASIADGADVNARDEWGLTPIDIAVESGHFDIAHYLLAVRSLQRDAATRSQRSRRAEPTAARRGADLLPTQSNRRNAPPGDADARRQ